MEFRLENPQAFWGLGLLALYWGRCFWKSKHLKDSLSWRKVTLNSLALLFCLIGLSRPQGGEAVTSQISQSGSLFIVMDVSQSMLAEDTLPSRMQFAVRFTERLLDQLSQVKVALYPFTLEGYMQMPLSSDLNAAKDLISNMSPSIATGQGTDITRTLEQLFLEIQKAQHTASTRGSSWVTPQVLLISDGESHFPVNDAIAIGFKNAGIPIFTVSVGGTQGVPIPIENKFSPKRSLLDASGRPVLTTAHPEVLAKIAALSGGAAFQDHFNEIPKLAQRLNQSLQIGTLSTQFKLTREFYPWCFLLAFFFLFWEFCFGRWEFVIQAVAFALCVSQPVHSAEPIEDERLAIEFYNLGTRAYQQGNLKESATQLEKSILTSLDPTTRKKALFNLGNTYLKMGEWEQSLQAYQHAYDTLSSEQNFNHETNEKISDNLALLAKAIQKQQGQSAQQSKSGAGGKSDGEGKKPGEQDPKGPQKFEDQLLSGPMKKKILDQISEEERDILQRLTEDRNKKNQVFNLKPW